MRHLIPLGQIIKIKSFHKCRNLRNLRLRASQYHLKKVGYTNDIGVNRSKIVQISSRTIMMLHPSMACHLWWKMTRALRKTFQRLKTICNGKCVIYMTSWKKWIRKLTKKIVRRKQLPQIVTKSTGHRAATRTYSAISRQRWPSWGSRITASTLSSTKTCSTWSGRHRTYGRTGSKSLMSSIC